MRSKMESIRKRFSMDLKDYLRVFQDFLRKESFLEM